MSVYIGFYYGDTSNINHTLDMPEGSRETLPPPTEAGRFLLVMSSYNPV